MVRQFAIVVVLCSIAACATQSRPPAVAALADPNSKVASAGTAAASAPAGTTTGAVAPVVDHPADDPNYVNQNYVKRGYKPVHRNGEILYCRSDTLTGTRFKNTVCLSAAQLQAADRNTQGTMDQMGKAGGLDCHVYKCGN
jgi:hypothetical protein